MTRRQKRPKPKTDTVSNAGKLGGQKNMVKNAKQKDTSTKSAGRQRNETRR